MWGAMMELSFEQKEDLGLKYVLDLLDPVCPYGAKRLKAAGFFAPGEAAALERELDNVETLVSALEQAPEAVMAFRHCLSALKDISGSLENLKLAALGEVELFEVTAFLLRLKMLIPLAQALPGYEKLHEAALEPVDAALSVVDPAGSGRLSFFVEDARTPALLEIRREKRELEKQLREPGADRDNLLAARLVLAKREEAELQNIYAAMSDALRPMLPQLLGNARAAGVLDACLCKAMLARRYKSCRPKVGGGVLRLEGALNPGIADALAERGQEFTPISAELPLGVTVLTGANMGGKSVAMKTITLNLSLALMGFFVFCEAAQVPLFEEMELINRDFSSATGGLSSFGGEILRFNEAVERLKAGSFSFIAMDEFARGTNAQEGAAIARGVVKYLNGQKAITLLATHYDGTAAFAARHYQVKGLRRLEEGAVPSAASGKAGIRLIGEYMDYGLISVDKEAECPRDALRICRILGMEQEILNNIQ